VEVFYGIEHGMGITFINIYGPCQDKEPFWSSQFANSFMKKPNMVIRGDLYFSLEASKVWGP